MDTTHRLHSNGSSIPGPHPSWRAPHLHHPAIRKPQPIYPNLHAKCQHLSQLPNKSQPPAQIPNPPRCADRFPLNQAIKTQVPRITHHHPLSVNLPRVLPVPATIPRFMGPRRGLPYPPPPMKSGNGVSFIPHYIVNPKYPSGKKLFRCPQCRYITDRKNNLKRHIGTMHQACGKILECCDVIFPSKASLRDHVILFHRSGYKCRYCSRNFCRKALLKRHLVVHSGQKEFVCTICDFGSNEKEEMDRHKRVHHMKVSVDENDNHQSTGIMSTVAWSGMYWNLLGLDVNGQSWMKSYAAYRRGLTKHSHMAGKSSHMTWMPRRLKATHSNAKIQDSSNTSVNSTPALKSAHANQSRPSQSQMGVFPAGGSQTRGISMHPRGSLHLHGSLSRLCTSPYKCNECVVTFATQHDLLQHAETCRTPRQEPARPLRFYQDEKAPSYPWLDTKQPEQMQVPEDESFDTLALIRKAEMQQKIREEMDIEDDDEEEDEDESEAALDLSMGSDRKAASEDMSVNTYTWACKDNVDSVSVISAKTCNDSVAEKCPSTVGGEERAGKPFYQFYTNRHDISESQSDLGLRKKQLFTDIADTPMRE